MNGVSHSKIRRVASIGLSLGTGGEDSPVYVCVCVCVRVSV